MEGSRGLFLSLVIAVCFYGNQAQRTECAQASVADIVFLVDGSSTIGVENFQEVRHFLRSFIEGLDIGADKVRVGLAQYSNEPHQEFLLKDHMDKRSLLAQVDNFPYRTGGTETGKAITFLQTQYFTKEAGSRADQRVPQIAVVITDGASADDVVRPALVLRRQGVIVFAIGVGAANQVQLQAIANSPHERFLFMIDSYQALQRLSQGLLQTVCVSVEDQRLALTQRFADIFFLVDSGMTPTDFGQIRTLLVRLVNQLNMGASAHRLGLAQFGQDIKVQFLLSAHKTKEETLFGLRCFCQRRVQPNEPRNLGAALTYASTNFFTTEAGSREDQGYRQFLVVVTGGDSDDDVFRSSRLVKAEGITVVGVGLGSATLKQMKIVATSPHIYQTASIAPALKTLFDTEQEMTTVNGECAQASVADIVFLVDGSSRIGVENFQEVRHFLRSFIEGLDIGADKVRVGLAQYSNEPHQEFLLKDHMDKRSLLAQVDNFPYRTGGTETGKAIYFLQTQCFTKEAGSRADQRVPQIAVVITDGASADDVVRPALVLRRQGVIVFAIGVGAANQVQLQAIANSPHERFLFMIDSYQALQRLSQGLLQTVCVSVEDQRLACEKQKADLVMLIDQSDSINRVDYSTMKKFMTDLVTSFKISQEFVRVGVAQFSSDAQKEFYLNEFDTEAAVNDRILSMTQLGGGANIGKALEFIQSYFQTSTGSRISSRITQNLILITDSDSQDKVEEAAASLRALGIEVFAIGIGKAHDREELLQITGTQKRLFIVQNFGSLEKFKKKLVDTICKSKLVPDAPTCEKQKADLVLLIDQSGSINQADYSTMKKFMTDLVTSFKISQEFVRVGVAQFSSDAQKEFYLNEFDTEAAVNDRILSMTQLGGGANIGKALEFIQSYFQTSTGSRISSRITQNLILITDSDSQDKVEEAAASLRALGIEVFAIGIGKAHDWEELLQITGTQKRLFIVQNFGSLEKFKKKLVDTICKSKLVPDAPTCEKQKADLVMLIDQSGSINQADYSTMKKFMTDLVTSFKISQEFVRVGVAQFSSDAQKEFYLNEFDTEAAVNDRILSMTQLGGGANIGKALEFIQSYFQTSTGSRISSRITQNLILITDSDSQDKVEEAAASLRALGIEVFAIGIGDVHDPEELLQITGTQKRLFIVQNFGSLEKFKKKLVDTICKSKLVPDAPTCEEQKADLVMLIDQSGSINQADYSTMKKFMTDLVTSFKISQEFVRVGVAQFSSDAQKEFYLNEFDTEAAVNDRILSMTQLGGGANIGKALEFIQSYFQTSTGSRISSMISQNLILITDSDSQDKVEEAAASLRALGIEVFAIGIGDAHDREELLQITGTQKRLFIVQNFGSLEKFKKKLVDTICKSKLVPDAPSE